MGHGVGKVLYPACVGLWQHFWCWRMGTVPHGWCVHFYEFWGVENIISMIIK